MSMANGATRTLAAAVASSGKRVSATLPRKAKRQVDCVAPGGAAAEGQGSCLGDVAKALGNFR